MINLNTEYTLYGRPVTVLTINRLNVTDRTGVPIPVLVETESGGLRSFRSDGTTRSADRLIEKTNKVERVIWVNVYETATAVYTNLGAANAAHNDKRLACVRFKVDVQSGHGLDRAIDPGV